MDFNDSFNALRSQISAYGQMESISPETKQELSDRINTFFHSHKKTLLENSLNYEFKEKLRSLASDVKVIFGNSTALSPEVNEVIDKATALEMSDLPPEILSHILSFASSDDLRSGARVVSKEWNEISNTLIRKEYLNPINIKKAEIISSLMELLDKKLYKEQIEQLSKIHLERDLDKFKNYVDIDLYAGRIDGQILNIFKSIQTDELKKYFGGLDEADERCRYLRAADLMNHVSDHKSIEDPAEKKEVILALCKALCNNQFFQQAYDLSKDFEHASLRDSIIFELGTKIPGYFSIVRFQGDKEMRTRLLSIQVNASMNLHLYQNAIKLAYEIPDEANKINAIQNLIVKQISQITSLLNLNRDQLDRLDIDKLKGDLVYINEVLEKEKKLDPEFKSKMSNLIFTMFNVFCNYYLAQGKSKESIELANKVSDEEMRKTLINKIETFDLNMHNKMRELLEAGKLVGAEKITEIMTNPNEKSDALLDLVKAYLNKKNPKSAKRIAETIPVRMFKDSALEAVREYEYTHMRFIDQLFWKK